MTSKRAALGGLSLIFFGLTIGRLAGADTADEAAIKKILYDGCKSWIAGKPSESIDLYLKDIVVFDVAPPRQKNYQAMVKFNQQLSSLTQGTPTCVYEEIHPVVLTDVYAYSTAILSAGGNLQGGKSYHFRERSTDVWKKVKGHWRVMHEHNSVPVDVISGVPDMDSNP